MIPLRRTNSSTYGEMFRNAIRSGTVNVRYSVSDFMPVRPIFGCEPEGYLRKREGTRPGQTV